MSFRSGVISSPGTAISCECGDVTMGLTRGAKSMARATQFVTVIGMRDGDERSATTGVGFVEQLGHAELGDDGTNGMTRQRDGRSGRQGRYDARPSIARRRRQGDDAPAACGVPRPLDEVE